MKDKFEMINGGNGYYYLRGPKRFHKFQNNPFCLFDLTREQVWQIFKTSLRLIIKELI